MGRGHSFSTEGNGNVSQWGSGSVSQEGNGSVSQEGSSGVSHAIVYHHQLDPRQVPAPRIHFQVTAIEGSRVSQQGSSMSPNGQQFG